MSDDDPSEVGPIGGAGNRHRLSDRLLGILLLAAVSAAGCSLSHAWPALYFALSKNHATEEEIRAELGSPHSFQILPQGGALWVYKMWNEDSGDLNRPPHRWCEAYRLVFDPRHVLRGWQQTRC